MLPRSASAAALAIALATSGCLGAIQPLLASDGATPELGPTTEPTWSSGAWWAYEVTVLENRSFRVALVVDATYPDGYRLGTNASAGFFGLPFHGNLSRDLNPEIGGDTWEMFRFPLHEGAAWTQELFGHRVRTTVHSAYLPSPDGTRVPGYRLEATTYGSTLATYTFAPSIGWMTSFQLRDPGNGDVLIDANLLDAGASFSQDYYVSELVHSTTITYPRELPGTRSFELEGHGTQLSASLVLEGRAGSFEGRLVDPTGQEVLAASLQGTGVADDHATTAHEEGTWHLEHRGVGAGTLLLQVHAIHRVEPGEGDGSTSPGSLAWGPLVPELRIR